ncbi:MAG: ATP synthase F1 subunit delta [Longimicrobiales bacterium]|nr:ATP synthase F1 subunit delta [Longimicrobiales bacterium]
MRDETVARTWASALFEAAARADAIDAFDEAIQTVAILLDEHADFRLFLETPRVAGEEKKRVVRDVFSASLPPQVVNFLLLTIDKRRQRVLREIARQYAALVDEHLNRAHVEVTVARPLDDATVEEIGGRLSVLLGKTAIPHVRVLPELLGGIIVRSGDTIYDGSLRRRLDDMRRQILAAPATASAQ